MIRKVRSRFIFNSKQRSIGVSGMHHRASYSRYGYVSQQKT